MSKNWEASVWGFVLTPSKEFIKSLGIGKFNVHFFEESHVTHTAKICLICGRFDVGFGPKPYIFQLEDHNKYISWKIEIKPKSTVYTDTVNKNEAEYAKCIGLAKKIIASLPENADEIEISLPKWTRNKKKIF